METVELLTNVSRDEDSRHQFKANMTNERSSASELVEFSNSGGGRLFIGVKDDGTIAGLKRADMGRLNQLTSNAASQSMRPLINPQTETIPTQDGHVLIITVPDGISKAYMGIEGVIWVKSGADKRRVTARKENPKDVSKFRPHPSR